MKVQVLSIFILSLLCRLDGKALQTEGDEREKNANFSRDKIAAEVHPSSQMYSDGSRNYETRYIPYVNGQPIFIPTINYNELSFNYPKQWQSKYQNLKSAYPKTNSEKNGSYKTSNPEMKKSEKDPSVLHDSGKNTKKNSDVLDIVAKTQGQKAFINLSKSSTDKVEDKYDSPQIVRPHKENVKQEMKHYHTKAYSKDAEYEYDLPEIKGAISKGTGFNSDSDDKYYDSPEVINSLDDALEDIPLIKRPVDKVNKKKVYNRYDPVKRIKYPVYETHKQVDSHTKNLGSTMMGPETYSSGSELLVGKPNTFITKNVKPTIAMNISKEKYFERGAKQKHQENQKFENKKNDGYSKNLISNSFKYELNNKKQAIVAIHDKDLYDYDSPVVVEARIKKSSENDNNLMQTISKNNLGEKYSEYENPVVIEALTKKEPAQNSEMQKKKINTVKDTEYQNYKYPIYFDSKKLGDGTAPNLKTPSPIIGLNDNVNPQTEFPRDSIEYDTLNDKFDGSGLVDARTSNEESRLKSSVWSLMSNFHSQERNKFKKCLTPNKEPGNCMPIQMCPVPDLQLTLNDLLKKVCTINDVFIGICCPEFPAETLKVQWDNISTVDDGGVDTAKPEECGQFMESSKDMQSWPWMAPLISVSTRRIFCGGVLIKEKYVLTAAHCTRKIPRNQILVVLGPLNSEQDPTNQEFEVVEIKRHAQYNPRSMQNDIALLKLSRKVPLGDKRRFICLPDEQETNVGEEAFMLGWQGSFAASKNEESLKVISPEMCRKSVKFIMGPNVMCTEPRTEDVMCNLDSGAPLTVKKDGKFHVIGIMTWNRNDCDSNFPTIFTRVSHFKKWIENHSS